MLSEIRRRARRVVLPLLGAGAMAYFGYHAVQGERGVVEWWKLQQEIARAAEQQQQTAAQKSALEHQVKLLSPGTLDADMLEERARVVLNMGRRNERVIFDQSL
ncbi:MAG: septum formation initiator [Alphaproteobacteria bacterium RIFOXYD12_FULL_60_8]|nr:MAG: septum formation initiator [Alphaproteobacteria bacterium RIFOXYD12_FULL_60_8]